MYLKIHKSFLKLFKRCSIFESQFKSILKHFSLKLLKSLCFTIFGGKCSCFVFITVTVSLWKSDRPVSKVKQSSKHFELLLRNKSIQDGLLTFLKQVDSLFHQVQHWNCPLAVYFHMFYCTYLYCTVRISALPISPWWVASLILLGLYEQHINHLHD